MDLNINVKVQVGVTPQLATFLTALLQSRPETPVQLPALDAPTEVAEAESEKPQRTPAADASVENPEPQAPEATAQQPEAAPDYKPWVDGPVTQPEKPLTEEDIRACMHRTRQRFEGEDYKENTDSELYKKYHKALTSQFKGIAAILGADKPSALPADKRAQFIAECDALIIDKEGHISSPEAPF